MSELILYKSERFYGIECDMWRNENEDILMTREQIGRALEYKNPQKAIDNLHSRNKERLDKFSVTLKVRGTDLKEYDVCLYSAKGIYEICRWSKQPKANEFMDWIWNLLEDLRKGEVEILRNQIEESKPKLELYEQVISAENCMTMLQVSKALKMSGRNKLFKFLRSEGILMSGKDKQNIPYQQFCDAGYFLVVIKPMIINKKIIDVPVTLVTPKGMNYIYKRITKRKALPQSKAQ